MKSVNIVLVDFNWYGHIPMYHLEYARAFAHAGFRVVSVSPRSTELRNNSKLAPFFASGHIVVGATLGRAQPPIRRIGRVWGSVPGFYRIWSKIRGNRSLRTLRASRRLRSVPALLTEIRHKVNGEKVFVFFPYLDDMLVFRGRIPNLTAPWAGILMSACHMGSADALAEHAMRELLDERSARRVLVLDECSKDCLVRYGPEDRVVLAPDITDTSLSENRDCNVEEILSKSKGRPIISLLGQISERKNVARFCELAAQAPSSRMFFVLWGECDMASLPPSDRKTLLDLLRRNPENVYIKLQRIESEESLNAVICASGVVYIRYKNFMGSSNLLTKAAYFGVPVFACSGGHIGRNVVNYGLGQIFEGDACAELDALLGLAGCGRDRFRRGTSAYALKNSPEALTATVASAFSELE